MTSFRKELVRNLIKHNMNRNNLNFDVNFILDNFFDEEGEEEESLDTLIKKDVAKLFNYIESNNQEDYMGHSPDSKKRQGQSEAKFEDPDTDLRKWSQVLIKSH
jgi:hypothetical protein